MVRFRVCGFRVFLYLVVQDEAGAWVAGFGLGEVCAEFGEGVGYGFCWQRVQGDRQDAGGGGVDVAA